ncbi:hypothetical protein [Gloeobacter kilaueensis]|uniref:hypothetical protein n=1 Tax=Gloeobacter kilaueensis TaxID=1416614 RepID=UPI000415C0CB|nr:hypothetical protein [Gloeobacter kilaueensis]
MNRLLWGTALTLLVGLAQPGWAQLARSGSQVLTDEPTGTAQDLKGLQKQSTDSSLLLNDNSNQSLEQLLQRKVEKAQIFVRSPIEAIDQRTYGLVTAAHLRDGELMQTQLVRIYRPEKAVNDDLITNQSTEYVWGLNNDIELTLDLQGANGSVPGVQGPYVVQRRFGINNGNIFQDITALGKFRLGDLLGGKSSVVVGLTFSRPSFTFTGLPGTNLPTIGRPQDAIQLIPSLELPITYKAYDDRYAFTISPRLAYFPGESAIYTPVNPGVSTRFGLTAGIGFGGAFRISPRFQIRGDATFILAGYNTVDRNSGLPTKKLVYNAGLRYLVNPRLAIDIFASNAYANSGAPSFTAIDSYTAIGVGLTFTQDRLLYFLDLPVNRQFADTFEPGVPPEVRRLYIPASFDLLDGSTVSQGTNQVRLVASTGTFAAAFRAGTLNDFEAGFYGDFAPAGPDESDGGLSTKIRFLHQPSGDPFTLSGVFTIGRTSSRACNFINGTRNGLEQAINGQPTLCPPVPGQTPAGDRGPIPPNLIGLATENIGELFVISLSFPTQYTLPAGHSLWVNPKVVYLQRGGDRSPLIGASFGGSLRVFPGLDLIAQVTPVFRGENAFVGDSLAQLMPWQAGVRFAPGLGGLSFDLFATNALGLSPYQSLRVRADNAVSVGLGLQLGF